jgi:beta-xylosidase
VVYFTARDTTGVLCIGRAESQSIEGPYKDLGFPMIRNASGMGSIDATAFYSEQQQQLYMIWKEDGNAVGLPTPIWAQAMDPRGLMLTGTKTMLLVNDLPWEGPLVEAPWIIERGNWHYLFYSANSYFNGTSSSTINLPFLFFTHGLFLSAELTLVDFTLFFCPGNYCVGVARSQNILGPFKKWPQPILHTAAGNWIGPGHCSVIPLQGTTDHWMMIYHSWKEGHVGGADDSRMLLMDSIVWDSTGWPSIPNNSPSIKPQQIPPM